MVEKPDSQVEVNRMALAMVVDEAAESIPYHSGEYQAELSEAIELLREQMEIEEKHLQ